VEARASAGQLVARDEAARQVLLEAEALDRVLDRAPLPSLAREAALADRIVAAAGRTPRMVRTGAETPAPSRDDAHSTAPGTARHMPWRAWMAGINSEVGRTAAVLAASLAIGIFIGLSGLSQTMLPALTDMTGITLDDGAYNLAQIDPFDEDSL
jgi:hypothetical protein